MSVSFFGTVQSFVQFLWNWHIKGGALVDQNTANIRSAICSGCHNNKPSNEVRKKTCCGGGKVANLVADAARATIIGKMKTVSDNKLLVCGLCGCDLKIKVWIPIDAIIKAEDANAYPSFCFMKKILEGKNV